MRLAPAGLALTLALAACGKPAPSQVAAPEAPQAPKVRIAQVGGTVFADTISAAGRVVARAAEAMPGSAAPAAAGSTAPANGYALDLAIPQGDAARLTLGAAAQVRFDAFHKDIVVGRLIRLGAPSDGTVAARISLPRDARLSSGLTGTARIVASGPGSTKLLIPPSAVVGPRSGAASVFVVDLATARLHARPVTLAEQSPDGIRVAAGLQQGEWVALSGADKLRDGMKIAPIGPAG
ncbi:hypothetical protein U1872_17240 [Sphingomonas sp. RB3P16]|uniref:efflux RND transporter periplasmic adaptor subunit n=1 Tax=Parasphingomonas frigoris TaxID=3096163 RepID=UPI002FC819E9